MGPLDKVSLRLLTLKDLDAVASIDQSLLGLNRRGYWENKLEKAEGSGVPSLAAEVDGEVIGFILGKASGWEYGVPENVGWIDTLGVVEEWQGRGISQLLFNEMHTMFKKVGIDTIYVFVGLIRFFRA